MNRRDVLRLLSQTTGAALAHQALVPSRLRAQISRPDWSRFNNLLEGRVTIRDATDYETRRRALVWNAIKPERFPAAIIHASSDTDVREAVRFARQHNLKVAVRGGGHNWHNVALREGGLLIDLSGLNQVAVDVAGKKAIAQPGVTGAALIGKLAPYGLAFPVANAAQVGLSGFLLNGGLGRNYRVWGPACASVEAIDMVDAQGELIRADNRQNQELFWAARGAGPGFFGVVTRFSLKLHAMPRAMMRTAASYALDDSDKLAAWLSDLEPLAPPAHVNCSLAGGVWRINAIAFSNSSSEGRDVLRPFENEPAGLRALTKNLYQPMSVEAVFGSPIQAFQPGPRYLGDSMVSNASPRDLMTAVRDVARTAPPGSAFAFVSLARPDGARLPDMAFSLTAAKYVHAHGLWKDPAQDAINVDWVRRTVAAVEPLRAGRYVGEADLAASPTRVDDCFSSAAWDQLRRLKKTYDPDDVFFSYFTN
jgi:FAD/FMN-containing dehydrogenase